MFNYIGSPILIPELISWNKLPLKQEENSCTCTEIDKTSDFLNIVNIRLGLTVLSYLAAGISFPDSAISNRVPRWEIIIKCFENVRKIPKTASLK